MFVICTVKNKQCLNQAKIRRQQKVFMNQQFQKNFRDIFHDYLKFFKTIYVILRACLDHFIALHNKISQEKF